MEKLDLKAKQSQSGAPCSPKEKERRKKQEDKSTGEMLESETNIEKLPYRENSAGERNERITEARIHQTSLRNTLQIISITKRRSTK